MYRLNFWLRDFLAHVYEMGTEAVQKIYGSTRGNRLLIAFITNTFIMLYFLIVQYDLSFTSLGAKNCIVEHVGSISVLGNPGG